VAGFNGSWLAQPKPSLEKQDQPCQSPKSQTIP